jgi:TonB family protein
LPQAKDLPKAPALPPAPPSLSAQEQPSAAARPGADEAAEPVVPLPPPPAEAEKPAARKPATAMDTLRNKVRQPLPAPRNEAPPLEPLPSSPLADLARRRYRNGIQSRVRDNHTYPAEFSCGIEAVVRITLARDGALVGSQLLQTSGDSRYDYAVDLTIRATRFQPLPDELPGDTFTENLRFTPKRCPSSNP